MLYCFVYYSNTDIGRMLGAQGGTKREVIQEADRLLLRGREVAMLLGISRALAFRWMQNGTLPVLRLPGSRTVRVPRAELLKFIADRTINPLEKRTAEVSGGPRTLQSVGCEV